MANQLPASAADCHDGPGIFGHFRLMKAVVNRARCSKLYLWALPSIEGCSRAQHMAHQLPASAAHRHDGSGAPTTALLLQKAVYYSLVVVYYCLAPLFCLLQPSIDGNTQNTISRFTAAFSRWEYPKMQSTTSSSVYHSLQ